MPFDAAMFERAKLEARQARVPAPALAPFFDEGEDPFFVVRGLTTNELHKALDAGKRAAEEVLAALASCALALVQSQAAATGAHSSHTLWGAARDDEIARTTPAEVDHDG